MKTCPSTESVAWFFMGEGGVGFNVSKVKGRLGFRVSPRCECSNSDMALLRPIMAWLDKNGVKKSLCKHNGSYSRIPNYRVSVDRFRQVKKFLSIIHPFLLGRKKQASALMLEFIGKFGRTFSPYGQAYNAYRRHDGLLQERLRFLEMITYYEKLRLINGHKGFTPKYTGEFFVDLWESELKVEALS